MDVLNSTFPENRESLHKHHPHPTGRTLICSECDYRAYANEREGSEIQEERRGVMRCNPISLRETQEQSVLKSLIRPVEGQRGRCVSR